MSQWVFDNVKSALMHALLEFQKNELKQSIFASGTAMILTKIEAEKGEFLRYNWLKWDDKWWSDVIFITFVVAVGKLKSQ